MIPIKLRGQLADDPFIQKCCIFNLDCRGGVTWHHPWIYAGRQIQEAFAILPACEYHHDKQRGFNDKEFKRISLQRATDEDLAKYPRKDWDLLKSYLLNEEKISSMENS